MGWGLLVWSALTAANGVVQGFWGFLLARMGVGVGEASYGPAANSLIGDLFPADRRARAMGWLFAYNFYTCVYTAVQDVVEPRLRATAMALFFAGLYLLGGGLGPVIVGGLSDYLAQHAMFAASANEVSEAFRALGLHSAMYLVPAAMGLTGVFLLAAISTYKNDATKMAQSAQ